jgi:predicted ribosomally synthesized peptide with nif11-like leader
VSAAAAKQFLDSLALNPTEQAKFKDAASPEAAAELAVSLGAAAGFDFTVDDVETWESEVPGDELTEADLEQVAGGGSYTCWLKTCYSSCPCRSGYCGSSV